MPSALAASTVPPTEAFIAANRKSFAALLSSGAYVPPLKDPADLWTSVHFNAYEALQDGLWWGPLTAWHDFLETGDYTICLWRRDRKRPTPPDFLVGTADPVDAYIRASSLIRARWPEHVSVPLRFEVAGPGAADLNDDGMTEWHWEGS